MNKYLRKFLFKNGLMVCALVSLAGLAAIVWFLFQEGFPVLQHVSIKDFLTGQDWYPTENPPSFQILPLIAGSIAVTICASVFAIPLGLMTAIYLSHIASPRVRAFFKPCIELLAAFPSVIIGFIGMAVLAPVIQTITGAPTGLNVLNASILLALMALPTICTISEDALRSVPNHMKEASLAVGATNWETLTKITIPGAASGISTAVMLGMSRVIGETMVVLMAAGGAAIIPETIFDPARPLPAAIVAEMAEAPFRSSHYHALFATGIVLFLFTFAFNLVAFKISKKYKLQAS
ncbi:phosphate ABC transporter permease subunit PstC [Turicimonas muris]|uniref:phosphate ABC transporter permease subunit PstC n=1 Tax=Turicimonas muris TaxID=1796652 RepID=UPI0023F0741F|nr:phosphate ABC transporter permease subunit PstC [Turicimonas muris]